MNMRTLPKVENCDEDLTDSNTLILVFPFKLGVAVELVLAGSGVISGSGTIFIFIFSGEVSDLRFLLSVFSVSDALFVFLVCRACSGVSSVRGAVVGGDTRGTV